MFKECRLFQARDFVSLLGPCFLLCRFHGLFPYKITSDNRQIAHSKPRLVLSLTIVLAYILILTYLIYHFDPTVALKYVNIPGLLQSICNVLLTSLIMSFSLLHTNSRLKLLQQLNVVSSTFLEKTFVRMSWVIHAKDIFGLFILIAQTLNVYSQIYVETKAKAFSLYSLLMVYALDMLYIDCVYVLHAGFKNVNDNLHNLRNCIITEKPHLLRRVYHKYRNPIILLELKALKERHHVLSETVQQLNNVFGFHIATTVVLTFTEITFSLYFYILWLTDNLNFEMKDAITYSYFLTSVAYHSIKLIAMICICEATKNEARRTGNVIHEMVICIADFDVKVELQVFSLQLLHRSNTFDAKGIVIDAALLKAIAGGIATYLLILIQFLLSSKNVKEEDFLSS